MEGLKGAGTGTSRLHRLPYKTDADRSLPITTRVLCRMLERDPSAKAIVFSQFTSFLDLCSFRWRLGVLAQGSRDAVFVLRHLLMR